MDLSAFLAAPSPAAPPAPVLDSVEPRQWWSRASWPDKQGWPGGVNWTFHLHGDSFDPGSLVLLGTRTLLPSSCARRRLITVWIVPPLQPATLPVRVRSGQLVSNSILITFT